MPSLQSWQQVIPESQLYFNSSYVQLRNRHYPPGGLNTTNYYNSSLGMGEMTRAAIEWYPVPNKIDSVANFSAWCHTTQIFQADFYRSQIEFYRRGSGLPERQLGSLYWQLEDQWTVCILTAGRKDMWTDLINDRHPPGQASNMTVSLELAAGKCCTTLQRTHTNQSSSHHTIMSRQVIWKYT